MRTDYSVDQQRAPPPLFSPDRLFQPHNAMSDAAAPTKRPAEEKAEPEAVKKYALSCPSLKDACRVRALAATASEQANPELIRPLWLAHRVKADDENAGDASVEADETFNEGKTFKALRAEFSSVRLVLM